MCVYLYACKLMDVSAPAAVTCGFPSLVSLVNIVYS